MDHWTKKQKEAFKLDVSLNPTNGMSRVEEIQFEINGLTNQIDWCISVMGYDKNSPTIIAYQERIKTLKERLKD
jgi:hypothetical protein